MYGNSVLALAKGENGLINVLQAADLATAL